MLKSLSAHKFHRTEIVTSCAIIFLIYLLVSHPLHAAAQAEPNFPASLPSPTDTLLNGETRTPEYVIIKPSDQATFSSETAARVASIPLKEGSTFNKGDTLLVLDCRLQEAELKKAQAQALAANAAQISAKKLQSYGSISEFEFIKATSDAQIAQADVDKLKTIVEKCIIKAPFNGSIAELMVHAHETVKPGDPLLKIVNIENLELEIQVPSGWLKWLHIGTVFNVHLNENRKSITAKIIKINPQIEPVSESVRITGIIDPPDRSLLPGMSGQASFPDNPANKNSMGKK